MQLSFVYRIPVSPVDEWPLKRASLLTARKAAFSWRRGLMHLRRKHEHCLVGPKSVAGDIEVYKSS